MKVTELELVSGDVALDFANTVEDRLEAQPEDVLGDASDLAEWGRMAGLTEAAGGRGDAAELRRALALRRHLTTLFDARLDGRPYAAEDLEALARAEAEAHAAATLEQGADGLLHPAWDRSSPATIRHAVALSAAALLSSPRVERLGRCAGPGCGWFFLDQTKRGNRRWCSMSDCGQAAKSANRRAARQSDAARR